MDGSLPVYHFYYGNADAEPGSIATSFPYSRRKGRPGTGQPSVTSYAVPRGTAAFWRDHFARSGADHGPVEERFGGKFVRVRHPAGLMFEVVEASDARRPWTTSALGSDVAARGFFGTVLSVRDVADASQFFVDALGFEPVGRDGAYYRFQLPSGGPASVLELLHEPERPAGSWHFGEGTFHHVAFHAEDDAVLASQKALYEELGYTDASEVKDRFYFHSMYVRAPGGILVECTANVRGGFYLDERPEELGQSLSLPPWYEDQRATILAQLEPVRLPAPPAQARLAPRTPQAEAHVEVPVAAGAGPGIAPSRTRADFASGGRTAAWARTSPSSH
jgi:glyoxalase family protein